MPCQSWNTPCLQTKVCGVEGGMHEHSSTCVFDLMPVHLCVWFRKPVILDLLRWRGLLKLYNIHFRFIFIKINAYIFSIFSYVANTPNCTLCEHVQVPCFAMKRPTIIFNMRWATSVISHSPTKLRGMTMFHRLSSKHFPKWHELTLSRHVSRVVYRSDSQRTVSVTGRIFVWD
jgi:hypothetical protein